MALEFTGLVKCHFLSPTLLLCSFGHLDSMNNPWPITIILIFMAFVTFLPNKAVSICSTLQSAIRKLCLTV